MRDTQQRLRILRSLGAGVLMVGAVACRLEDPLEQQIRAEGELIMRDVIIQQIVPDDYNPQLTEMLRFELDIIRQSREPKDHQGMPVGLRVSLNTAVYRLYPETAGTYLARQNKDTAIRSCAARIGEMTRLTTRRLNTLSEDEKASVIKRLVDGGKTIAYRSDPPKACPKPLNS